jgi:arylsulfatase A
VLVVDNGAHNEGGHNYLFFDSSGPLRGFKRSLYEGGIRSPIMVRWPGTVPAQISTYTWAFWDFLPTIADLVDVPVPGYTDGISILPTLLGQTQPPKDYLYWEFCTNNMWGNAVRQGSASRKHAL